MEIVGTCLAVREEDFFGVVVNLGIANGAFFIVEQDPNAAGPNIQAA